uniref:FMRFamide receptor n=1 Tax=Lygus hesperus TaxID=30085 RepID=A0A146M2D6_LYGHE
MASRRRRGMTTHQDLTAHQERENRLTIMLIYVVFEFIICFSINGFMSIQNAIIMIYNPNYATEYHEFGHLFILQDNLRPVGLFFELFNASANFLSYVTFGQPFRKTLVETLCCCCRQQERRPGGPRLNLNKIETSDDTPM